MTANADPFDLSGGHPALDFVNTLDERPFPEPVENLADYSDLVRFAELTGLVAPGQAESSCASSPRPTTHLSQGAHVELREHLYGMLTALRQRKTDSAAHACKRYQPPSARRAAAQVLTVSKGEAIVGYDWRSPHAAEVPLHACALAIEDLLTAPIAGASANAAPGIARFTSSTAARAAAGTGAA